MTTVTSQCHEAEVWHKLVTSHVNNTKHACAKTKQKKYGYHLHSFLIIYISIYNLTYKLQKMDAYWTNQL
jgi:hypothetical protein